MDRHGSKWTTWLVSLTMKKEITGVGYPFGKSRDFPDPIFGSSLLNLGSGSLTVWDRDTAT
jgi:hypothetical protein